MDDLQYVLEMTGQARSISLKWHPKVETWRKLYNMQRNPATFNYVDPSFTNAVDVAVGILAANRLDFRAHGFTADLQEEKETSRIERFLLGMVDAANRQTGLDVEYENLMQLVRDGVTVTYLVWDRIEADSNKTTVEITTVEGVEKQQVITKSPFYWEVIDPLEINLLPGAKHGRWQVVARVVQESFWDIYQKYGYLPAEYKDYPTNELKVMKADFIDYWEIVERPTKETTKALTLAGIKDRIDQFLNRDLDTVLTPVKTETVIRHAIVFNQQFLSPLVDMKGYYCIPYHVAFYKPVERVDAENWASGIIAPMQSSVEALSRAINRRDHQISVFSEIPLLARSGTQNTKINIDPGIGRQIHLGPKDDIAFPRWPGNPPDVEEHISFLSKRLQQSSFNDALFLGNLGAGSGYALAQISDTNRIRLLQPKRHLEQFYSNLAESALKMLKGFAPKSYVRVYGKQRGSYFAEQVSGAYADDYMVRALIKPEFPSERQRNHSMAAQTAGLLSMRTIMERYLDVEDSEREYQRKVTEEVMSSPPARQYAMMKTLRRMMDEGDADAAAIVALMSGGQLTMPGGETPESTNSNLAGGVSSTGRPPRQVAGGPPAGQEGTIATEGTQ